MSQRDDGPMRWFGNLSRRMQALVLFAAALIVLLGLMFFIAVVIEPARVGEPVEDRSGAVEEAASPEDQSGVDAPEDQAGADGSEDQAEGRISGDWTLWWTNADGNTNPAFGIRFKGVDSGTVDVTNDDTATDTFFELEGDELSLGWTRVVGGEPSTDYFVGTIFDEDTIEGVWYRPGSECSNGVCVPTTWELEVVLFRD